MSINSLSDKIVKSLKEKMGVLVNLAPESNPEDILYDLYTNLREKNKVLIISRERINIISSDNINVIKLPKESLELIFSCSINIVIIYMISPYCEIDGFWIEIIIQKLKGTTKLIWLSSYSNFTDISAYFGSLEVINQKSTIKFKIFGYEKSKTNFLFEYKLNYKIHLFIKDQTIIYSTSKKAAEITADFINKNSLIKKNISISSIVYDDPKLSNYVLNGIGYYHNGLSENDKDKLIDMYKDKKIIYLVTTTYLSNLKCKTLIFKSSKEYNQNGYREMKITEMLKIINFCEANGSVVILTENKSKEFYSDIFLKNKHVCLEHVRKEDPENDFKNIFGYSSIEENIPEMFLSFLLYDKLTKINIENIIKDSYFFFQVKKRGIDFPLDNLVLEILEELKKKYFITKLNEMEINEEYAKLFFESTFSYESFIEIETFDGSEDNIIEKLNQLQEFKNLKKFNLDKKTKKQSIVKSIIKYSESIDQKNYFYINNLLKSMIKIKEFHKRCLSKFVIIYSKFLSKDKHLFYLKPLIKSYDFGEFDNGHTQIKINAMEVEIEIKDNLEYYLIIEKNNIAIINVKFTKQIFIDNLDYENYILYVICINDFYKSIILEVKNSTVRTDMRYYKNVKFNQKSNSQKIIKKINYIEGIKLETYEYNNMTLPKWFIK